METGSLELSLSLIEELKDQGYSQSDIARMFGKTRQAVSWHKRTYGGKLTPREEVARHFPWKVPHHQNQSSPYRRLRDHGEYVATGGKGMSKDKLSRLRSFYRKLREGNLILEFDPQIEPISGVSNRGGFAFRALTEADADLLIRVNEYTCLTDEGRMIWRLPTVDP
jgi:hypothetical protein